MPTLAVERIEQCLAAILHDAAGGSPLRAALDAALLGPGKRLRPLLTIAAYSYARPGQPVSDAVIAIACTFELLHAASLIYDDLPCMDNATLRRGQPALHIDHGEATALLAAISLINIAYRTVARVHDLDPAIRLDITALLAETTGPRGLAAGQYADLHAQRATLAGTMRHLKTGILFQAAARAGALCAGADATISAALSRYADHLGTAFQLLDDLQDHDAPENEARLQAELRQLLAQANAALELHTTGAAPLRSYLAMIFGTAP